MKCTQCSVYPYDMLKVKCVAMYIEHVSNYSRDIRAARAAVNNIPLSSGHVNKPAFCLKDSEHVGIFQGRFFLMNKTTRILRYYKVKHIL